MLRRVLYRDGQGEFVKHDGARYAFTPVIDVKDCPAPRYPVLVALTPDYRRVDIYRYPTGEEIIGHGELVPDQE